MGYAIFITYFHVSVSQRVNSNDQITALYTAIFVQIVYYVCNYEIRQYTESYNSLFKLNPEGY